MFRSLGEVLQTLVAQGVVDGLGEPGVDAPAQPLKGTGTNVVPAKFFRETPPVKEVHTNRCMTTATTRARPRSAVVIHLVVDNSGRETHEGGHRLPAFRRNSWREQARETGLRVVHSAALSNTGVSMRSRNS